MNIAFFLLPKTDVAYVYEDFTLRQALEKMRSRRYTAIPVIDREGKYVCTVTEGDFLWYLADSQQINNGSLHQQELRSVEDVPLSVLLRRNMNPPIHIMADMEQLVTRALEQNFVPVVDDTGVFIGIITRRAILQYEFRTRKD